MFYFAEMFPFAYGYNPWVLAAWNAMAVDQHVEKPAADNAEGNPAGTPAHKSTVKSPEKPVEAIAE